MPETFIFILVSAAFVIAVIHYRNKDPLEDEDEKETEEIIEPEINDATPQLTESYLTLGNYVGQEKAIEYIKGHINYAKRKNKPLAHLLLWGGGGLGKSTLVKAISAEMGGRYIELLPANVSSSKELFTILFQKICPDCEYANPFNVNSCLSCKAKVSTYFTPRLLVKDNDILFIEEIHRLKDTLEEAMYSLMQDRYMVVRFNGADQRVNFPAITIAGATTRLGDLNKPFRDRFKITAQLLPYTEQNMQHIAKTYADHYGVELNSEIVLKVAKISCGIPRIAKRYVEDLATIGDVPNMEQFDRLLSLLRVDENGLDATHRKMLKYILMRMQAMKNGAAGAPAIASSSAVTTDDYINAYEPLLLYHEFVVQSSRGRRLTDKCLQEYFPGIDRKTIRT